MSDKPQLTHVDEDGRASMVDVGGKAETLRTALASGRVTMSEEAFRLLAAGEVPKGNVMAAARIAGIMAAKRTSDLIPLCHPLPISKISVNFTTDRFAEVTASGRTGVEMEALTAVSVACLTLYDMLKSADQTMVIGPVRLETKTGGARGDYHRA